MVEAASRFLPESEGEGRAQPGRRATMVAFSCGARGSRVEGNIVRNREDAAALGSPWPRPSPPAQHPIHACSSEGVVAAPWGVRCHLLPSLGPKTLSIFSCACCPFVCVSKSFAHFGYFLHSGYQSLSHSITCNLFLT